MACPYAKKIRGTVAYCSLINKKVSTLRYPCKGNYRRCPIYQRYRARAQPRPAPPRETAPAPAPPAPAPAPAPAQPAPPPPAPAPPPSPPPRPVRAARPSQSLCDSLILAALITSGVATERFRGSVGELERKLVEATRGKDDLLFYVGSVSNYSLRVLAHRGMIAVAFERGGQPICGDEAMKLYDQLKSETVDGIIYRIDWESIPLWRETIRSEFS